MGKVHVKCLHYNFTSCLHQMRYALILLNFTISSVSYFAHAGESNDGVGSELRTHSAWCVTCKSIMRLRADFTVVHRDL